MKKNKNWAIIGVLMLLVLGCSKKNDFDASGSFEAEEIMISSEANGIIKALNIEEGQVVDSGMIVGYIDSTQLYLKKKQIESQIEALLSRRPNIKIQIGALEEQLKALKVEKNRVESLIKADAAPKKQSDDINAQIDIINKQIEAQRSVLEISTDGINKESLPLHHQLEQISDQLYKCQIMTPIRGTILNIYSKEHEMAMVGKPIFKIADLSNLILRVYITGNQLSEIKLNQNIKVFTDNSEGGYDETEGIIVWISDKAEFTPKTIQTRDERANMVYAIKVKVRNDGKIKIGMHGDVKF